MTFIGEIIVCLFSNECCTNILFIDIYYIYIYKVVGVLFQKIEKLKARLHLTDVADTPRNQHVVFVDSNKEGLLMCLPVSVIDMLTVGKHEN